MPALLMSTSTLPIVPALLIRLFAVDKSHVTVDQERSSDGVNVPADVTRRAFQPRCAFREEAFGRPSLCAER